jgi:hypothetical protein
MRMHVAKAVTTVIAGITIGAGVFGTGKASAETPFVIDGWVTTPIFRDPLPFPTAHYSGVVTAPGSIRVWADCIKGGLGGPNAPCLTSNGNLGIWDRVLNWQNLTTQQRGQVTSAADGSFVADPGAGQVNVQILKPGDGAGVATGTFSS